MSSNVPTVDVRGLSKKYQIRHNVPKPTNVVEAVAGGWRRLRGSTVEPFWALRDVSFTVARGEVISIIGNNGAGKSTLLKILSRIVEPTDGEAYVRGRLGSLLEVGTGFHPDLTGRENIFLNGSMLGMSRAVVQRQFDNIVEFSGVERFLDTPVKRYSSGMYVRLAFSVAAHLDCDVLIVDEVLAVGDDAFQRKCLGKINDVVGEGRTVLFVSHNMSAVTTLTNRAIVMERGRVAFDGLTSAAVERYLGSDAPAVEAYTAAPSPERPTITKVDVRTSLAGQVQGHGRPMDVVVEVTTPAPVPNARLGVNLVNRAGTICAISWVFDSERPICRTAGVHRLTCRFPYLRLAPGQYSLRVGLSDSQGTQETLERICPFEVQMLARNREGGFPNNQFAYIEDAEWTVTAGVPGAEALSVR